MNKIIAGCNKCYNGSKGESEYPETINTDFSHIVKSSSVTVLYPLLPISQCDRGAKLIQLGENCVFQKWC